MSDVIGVLVVVYEDGTYQQIPRLFYDEAWLSVWYEGFIAGKEPSSKSIIYNLLDEEDFRRFFQIHLTYYELGGYSEDPEECDEKNLKQMEDFWFWYNDIIREKLIKLYHRMTTYVYVEKNFPKTRFG